MNTNPTRLGSAWLVLAAISGPIVQEPRVRSNVTEASAHAAPASASATPSWQSSVIEKIANGNRCELLPELEAKYAANKQDADLLGWLAELSESCGDLEQAVEWTTREIEVEQDPLKRLRIGIRLESMRHRLAAGQQERKDSPSRSSAKLSTYRGYLALREKQDVDGAKKLFAEALRQDPAYSPAFFDLATIEENTGELQNALEHFEQFLKLEVTDDYRARAEIAVDRLRQLLTGRPLESAQREAKNRQTIAIALQDSDAGRDDLALLRLEKRAAEDPSAADVRRLRAAILASRGQGEDAIKELHAAEAAAVGEQKSEIANDRKRLEAVSEMSQLAASGLAKAEQGKHAEASELLERAWTSWPGDEELELRLVNECMAAKDVARALPHLRTLSRSQQEPIRNAASTMLTSAEQMAAGRIGWHDEIMPAGLQKQAQKDVYKWEADGSPMVFVPGGTFTMGSNSDELQSSPGHSVTLDGFYIDLFEVSNAQYKRFVQTSRRQLPPAPDWDLGNDLPVVNVSWEDALAYAQASGKSLPTEAQWEYAARFPDERVYPWGVDWTLNKANFCDASSTSKVRWRDASENDGYPVLAPVNSMAEGRSALGLFHMAGNVKEWCLDWYSGYSGEPTTNPSGPSAGSERVIRGGSWLCPKSGLKTTSRFGLAPAARAQDLGFRTVVRGTAVLSATAVRPVTQTK